MPRAPTSVSDVGGGAVKTWLKASRFQLEPPLWISHTKTYLRVLLETDKGLTNPASPPRRLAASGGAVLPRLLRRCVEADVSCGPSGQTNKRRRPPHFELGRMAVPCSGVPHPAQVLYKHTSHLAAFECLVVSCECMYVVEVNWWHPPPKKLHSQNKMKMRMLLGRKKTN